MQSVKLDHTVQPKWKKEESDTIRLEKISTRLLTYLLVMYIPYQHCFSVQIGCSTVCFFCAGYLQLKLDAVQKLTAQQDEQTALPQDKQLHMSFAALHFEFFRTSNKRWSLVSLGAMGTYLYCPTQLFVWLHQCISVTQLAYSVVVPLKYIFPGTERTLTRLSYPETCLLMNTGPTSFLFSQQGEFISQ